MESSGHISQWISFLHPPEPWWKLSQLFASNSGTIPEGKPCKCEDSSMTSVSRASSLSLWSTLKLYLAQELLFKNSYQFMIPSASVPGRLISAITLDLLVSLGFMVAICCANQDVSRKVIDFLSVQLFLIVSML